MKSNSIASGWASVKICFRILFYVHCNDGVKTEKDSEGIVENTQTNKLGGDDVDIYRGMDRKLKLPKTRTRAWA